MKFTTTILLALSTLALSAAAIADTRLSARSALPPVSQQAEHRPLVVGPKLLAQRFMSGAMPGNRLVKILSDGSVIYAVGPQQMVIAQLSAEAIDGLTARVNSVTAGDLEDAQPDEETCGGNGMGGTIIRFTVRKTDGTVITIGEHVNCHDYWLPSSAAGTIVDLLEGMDRLGSMAQ